MYDIRMKMKVWKVIVEKKPILINEKKIVLEE